MILAQFLFEGGMPTYHVIEWISIIIEFIAVMWIFFGVAASTLVYFYRIIRNNPKTEVCYTEYRHALARSLMLGLEILVAADVIRTVALEPTLQSVAVLGILVLIRILLGWSLVVEIEGHWPWQSKPKDHDLNQDFKPSNEPDS
jgi:uncharacterized membrane protein